MAANVQRWLSVAAGEIAYGPCAARLVTVFGVELDLENAKSVANHLLGIMDQTLASTNFLVGEAITVVDVAGYTYVAHAPEGGVSLKSLIASAPTYKQEILTASRRCSTRTARFSFHRISRRVLG